MLATCDGDVQAAIDQLLAMSADEPAPPLAARHGGPGADAAPQPGVPDTSQDEALAQMLQQQLLLEEEDRQLAAAQMREQQLQQQQQQQQQQQPWQGAEPYLPQYHHHAAPPHGAHGAAGYPGAAPGVAALPAGYGPGAAMPAPQRRRPAAAEEPESESIGSAVYSAGAATVTAAGSLVSGLWSWAASGGEDECATGGGRPVGASGGGGAAPRDARVRPREARSEERSLTEMGEMRLERDLGLAVPDEGDVWPNAGGGGGGGGGGAGGGSGGAGGALGMAGDGSFQRPHMSAGAGEIRRRARVLRPDE